MTWDNLLRDETVSQNFDELHARIEQYQVYSLVWCDQTVTTKATTMNSGRDFVATNYVQTNPDGTTTVFPYGGNKFDSNGNLTFVSDVRVYNIPIASVVSVSNIETSDANKCIAYQTFCPQEKIQFDFADLVRAYPEYAIDQRQFYSSGDFFTFGVAKSTHRWNDTLSRSRSDYKNLIFGNQNDSRLIPQKVQCTAKSSREITVRYYRQNPFENHPKILATLDFVVIKKRVKKGELYILPIPYCVLGCVFADGETKSEILDGIVNTNYYHPKYLFQDNLADLFTHWDTFFPPIPPPTPRPLGVSLESSNLAWVIPDATTWTETNWAYYAGGAASEVVTLITEEIHTPLIRVMAANNDRWGHGLIVTPQHRPAPDHPLFNFDHQKLFEELQPDGSYGTYMTDSPRVVEIWQALGAGSYATYDDHGEQKPRVANLGWMIERMGNILGLRRQPNGKYLDKADQAKYDRNRLNSPTWQQGDYDLNSWGNRGYALRHLPTAYADDKRQDNQYDLVHDLPQLLAAILDQIDLGQGLQHTAEIRLKVGKEVQAYPNIGQLTIDLAARVIELEALVQKIAVMQIETSNSVRELYPGIGIPVATKSVLIDIGGQQQQIFYPGFQGGKGSILDSLSAIKVNLGIVLGQLMPQKKADNRWNPFDRKPKS